MNYLCKFAVAMTAVGLLGAAPAAAVVKIATFTGTLVSGLDHSGLFGAPDTDMTGAAYILTYRYDRELGQTSSNIYGDTSSGGLPYPKSGPIISTKLTINGITRSIPSDYENDVNVYTFIPYTRSVISYESLSYAPHGSLRQETGVYMYTKAFGPVTTSLDSNIGPVTVGVDYGAFYVSYVGSNPYSYTEVDTFIFGEFLGTPVNATFSVSDLPEPAGWALLIAGFGLTGAAARRRRAVPAA